MNYLLRILMWQQFYGFCEISLTDLQVFQKENF